jgi:hypothetical protein
VTPTIRNFTGREFFLRLSGGNSSCWQGSERLPLAIQTAIGGENRFDEIHRHLLSFPESRE